MTHILIISPEPWDGHFVSKHHYAMELARRGKEVLFYGPPSSGRARIEKIDAELAGLRILYAPPVMPGLRLMPQSVRNMFEARWLRQIEALAGKPIDVVWLFENSRFYDMQFAGNRLKVYHQVDLNQDFHPEKAARSADFAFCTSDVIAERLTSAVASASTPLTKIHHGLSSAALERAIPQELGDGQHVMYVGNLSMSYLDLYLMADCVAKYPTISFHFVGGGGETLRQHIGKRENVVWHGKVPFDQVPALVASADVLLVAYARQFWNHQGNPHKVMEYLASGRTIVATWTEEYRDHADLLEMVDDPKEFVLRLGQVLNDLPHYNSNEKSAARRAFAHDHTYARQLDRIADALGEYGYLVR